MRFDTRRPSRLEPAAVGALLLLVAPAALSAQEVHARLLGGSDGRPVTGALVQLHSEGSVVDQDLSGPSGGVELTGRGDGTYRVRVQRIGYETWTSGPLQLRRAAEPEQRTFRVPLAPIRLRGVQVPVESRCRMPAEQGRRLARYWDQIETALALTSAARESDSLVFTVRSYRRRLERSGEQTGLDSAAVRVRRSLRPFDPPSVDSLVRFGFMVERDPGRYRYYAPSPTVLRSGAFLETHCLRLRSGEEVGRPEWIGVGFRPAPGRGLPEVAGTLWLERERAWLRRLDFRYVQLGFHDTPRLTGRVEFLRLPPNRWVIESWSTQIPRLAFQTNLEDGRPARLVVAGIDEVGAQVLSVQRGLGGGLLYHHRRSTIYGTVAAGQAGRADDPYVVRLASGERTDTTEARGTFALTPFSPGGHTVVAVRARDGRADTVARRTLQLEPGEVRRLDLGELTGDADPSGPG